MPDKRAMEKNTMNTLCKPFNRNPAKQRFIPRKGRPSQLGKYKVLWDKIFLKWGWADKPEKERENLRHSINEDLFGAYRRPGSFSNEDWTVMFFALEIIERDGILVWSKEMADYAREEGLRRVYTWWIDNAGLDIDGVEEYGAPEYYIAAIARDRFGGVADWRTLDSYRLWQLFITIKNRVKAAQKRGASLWENSETEPESSDNCPF